MQRLTSHTTINTKLKKRTIKNHSSKNIIVGVNYESQRIIRHAIHLKANFIVNLQIAMDAPFHGVEANEKVRSKGRTEEQLFDYDSKRMQAELAQTLYKIKQTCNQQNIHKIIIQIARGRSGKSFYDDIIHPLVTKILKDIHVDVIFGYREKQYYTCTEQEKYIFLNIGMFARIGTFKLNTSNKLVSVFNNHTYPPGRVFECRNGITLNTKHKYLKQSMIGSLGSSQFISTGLRKCYLIGILDDMPFVTTEHYSLTDFLPAVKYIYTHR